MAKEFLYRIKPTRLDMLRTGPTPEEAHATQEHFAYVRDGVRDGRVLLAGRTLTADPETFGVVIFRADSEEEAQRFMASDPAVAASVMNAELFPFRVALLADAWPRD
jgi:uncharacterized protein YciI